MLQCGLPSTTSESESRELSPCYARPAPAPAVSPASKYLLTVYRNSYKPRGAASCGGQLQWIGVTRPPAPRPESTPLCSSTLTHSLPRSPLFRMFETFSYLPPLTDAEISRQVDYIVNNGWSECLPQQRGLRRRRVSTGCAALAWLKQHELHLPALGHLLMLAEHCSSSPAIRVSLGTPLLPCTAAYSCPRSLALFFPLQPPAWSSLSLPAPTPATRTASA